MKKFLLILACLVAGNAIALFLAYIWGATALDLTPFRLLGLIISGSLYACIRAYPAEGK